MLLMRNEDIRSVTRNGKTSQSTHKNWVTEILGLKLSPLSVHEFKKSIESIVLIRFIQGSVFGFSKMRPAIWNIKQLLNEVE